MNKIPAGKEYEYVDNAFEAINDYELKESEAKLEFLDQQEKEILNSKEPSNSKECKGEPRRKGRLLHAKSVISPKGATLSEFSSFPKELGGSDNSPEGETSETSETGNQCNTKMQRHPNTMRKYTAILLAFFSNLETEYVTPKGEILTKKLPVIYGTREKLISIEQHEFSQLMNGNTNYIPRASLTIDSIVYDPTRQINKSSNVASNISMQSLAGANPYAEIQAAPSPYNINLRMNIVTRGMNDALMLAEQVGSSFNPFASITMREFEGGPETTVRLMLEGITFEPPEMDEYSQNEVISEYNFTLYGNLYKPGGIEYLANNININYNIDL